jgi:hypothetical protein
MKMTPTVKVAGHQAKVEPYALTMEGAVQYSGMSRTRIEGLLSEGKVEAKRVGRRTLVLAASLRAHLDSLPAAR